METRNGSLMGIFFIFLSALGLFFFGSGTGFAAGDNQVRPGEFVIEPPTLICLGFEWYIEGDDNHNAAVEAMYRKKGDAVWKKALPLLRLHRERTVYAPFNYVAPNMFAGSIFDLEPDSEYECRFVMSDPDGVLGEAEKMVTVRTRPEPKPFEGGRIFHLYPPGYKGPKQEPAFNSLMAAYYRGSSQSDHSTAYQPRVEPGDMILVHGGLYKDTRFLYGRGLGTPFDGTYYLTRSGTPEKPIVIKAAGDGEAIFDGDGCFNLFNVMAANYNYFEGLTIRNTDIAFWAGIKNIAGSSGLTVKKCRFENIGIGVHTDYSGSKNFYIADNMLIGREDPNHLMGWIGQTWEKLPGFPALNKSNYAVKVYGQGHVVCHNYVANFHDGIDNATYGDPDGYPNVTKDRMPVSIDIYNNDITNVADNAIEADGAMHNIRIFRNRCLNHAHRALSSQPVLGGPAYFMRNIVYHAPEGGSIKNYGSPSGILFYHNTLCSEVALHMADISVVRGLASTGGGDFPGAGGGPMNYGVDPSSNVHFRNNLILGQGAFKEIFFVDTFTNYTTSDCNGFRPNEGAEFPFAWSSPPPNILADYSGPRELRKFKTLAEYRQGTGQDAHSVLIDWDIFVNAGKPDPVDPRKIYKAGALDFQLRPNSVAVDAGCILPNVNDDFTGRAPDLGAMEVGLPTPIYGPRP